MVAPKSFDVAVLGAGLSAFHAAEELLKRSKTATVAFVHGQTFQEFPFGAAIFLNDAEQHLTYVCGDPKKWQLAHPRLTYFMSAVESVEHEKKEVRLKAAGPDANKVIQYKALIVATGSKMPLFAPVPGASLSDRVAEVRAACAALKGAATVVFNGAGLVGLEMCGDFRAKVGYNARVVLLTRSGKVLDTDFGEKAQAPQPDFVAKCAKILTEKFKVEIRQGVVVNDPEKFSLSAGALTLESGEVLNYDVYIPCFSLGFNTSFLSSALLESSALKSNECLQSTVSPAIFGVGVTTQKLTGHPIALRVTAAAKTAAHNALLFLNSQPPIQHVDKESPPPMEHPISVKIGHGKGGYLLWSEVPTPGKLCCCVPCGGGFPFCPPPCCWCCMPGCARALGSCGGPPEGEGPAVFMPSLLKVIAGQHGYKGAGDYGPEAPGQQAMS